MKSLTTTTGLISLPLTGSVLAATPRQPPTTGSTTAPQAGKTADEQSQTKADLALAQRIRQAIVKDKALSLDAHNCKVITAKGQVEGAWRRGHRLGWRGGVTRSRSVCGQQPLAFAVTSRSTRQR